MRVQIEPIQPRIVEYKRRLRALVIDGKTYIGVETAIKNYLKNNDLKMKDVMWEIGDNFIITDDIKELVKEFNWDEV